MEKRDLVIIGGGPSGMTLAHVISQSQRTPSISITILEKESSMGGCHRVSRVDRNGEMLFTEHSPRVYTDRYVTFDRLLKDLNVTFKDVFVKYDFAIADIGQKNILRHLSLSETFALGVAFMRLCLNSNYGKDVSVDTFTFEHNFSDTARYVIDRVCRLTDGAGMDRYSLNQFLQGINQFSTLYQPRYPTDEALFPMWEEFLKRQNVSLQKSATVFKLEKHKDQDQAGYIVHYRRKGKNELIEAKQVVLALPPRSMDLLLKNSMMEDDVFNHPMTSYAEQTEYNKYIAMTFHYDTKLRLPKVHGFPGSEWGIVFIVLSDYMTFAEHQSQTVISLSITDLRTKSERLGKRADECDDDELEEALWYYLRSTFPNIPKPVVAIRSVEKDSAFINVTGTKPLSFASARYHNLFNVGSQNGYSPYSFTSMESAVTNAVVLANIMYPDTKRQYRVLRKMELTTVVVFFVIVFVCFVILKNL
jgi:hypothetical protein